MKGDDKQNPIRTRAKEYFPTVLLTLLSIVQAIALELLWAKIVENDNLFEATSEALLTWLQITSSLIGLMLIWVVYAGNVMRFRWVPNVQDSIYPFLIGIIEFWLVEAIGNGRIGYWLLAIGFMFGAMTWISQTTMRRARLDGDNTDFFKTVSPATFNDFLPQIIIFTIFCIVGIYFVLNPVSTMTKLGVMIPILLFLAWQFYSTAVYWDRSITHNVADAEET